MDGRELAPGRYAARDLQVGDWWRTPGLVVTESQIVGFAGLSGDFFDVHMDDEFARAEGFPGRIAHGLLVLSLVDGLKNRAKVQLEAIATLSWTWDFKVAVVAGDRISVTVRIESVRPTKRPERSIALLALAATNQRGEIVQEGRNTLLMRT
jgi:3-hydroxybutyryl-CoA dehydratase